MDISERGPGYWAVLPAAVRYDRELTQGAKILYGEISSLAHKTGYCYASNEYFRGLYGISERTLQRYLRALVQGRYIRIEDGDGGKGRRRIYAGFDPLQNPVKNGGVTVEPRQSCRGNPDKNDGGNIEQEKRSEPPKAPQGAGADFVPKQKTDWKPERFDAFWAYYPLHKSKQAAMRAWDKLKPSDELLAVIGKALRRQIAEEKARAERERRPFEWKIYASTYLNGARWTDEPDELPNFGGNPVDTMEGVGDQW